MALTTDPIEDVDVDREWRDHLDDTAEDVIRDVIRRGRLYGTRIA